MSPIFSHNGGDKSSSGPIRQMLLRSVSLAEHTGGDSSVDSAVFASGLSVCLGPKPDYNQIDIICSPTWSYSISWSLAALDITDLMVNE